MAARIARSRSPAPAAVRASPSRGIRTNPAASVPATAPRVLIAYRRATAPAAATARRRDASSTTIGSVAPMATVGTSSVANSSRKRTPWNSGPVPPSAW